LDLAPSAPWSSRWQEAVASWVRASPLTDLATAARDVPPFAWSGAALGLVSTPPGRILALRSIDRQGEHAGAISALRRAAQAIELDSAAGRASDFVDELEQMQRVYQSAL
jgi:hypothetical protein